MAPRTTRAIGIFANLACVVSLTLRNSDRPLFPKADTKITEKSVNLGAANGQKQPSADQLLGISTAAIKKPARTAGFVVGLLFLLG